MPYIQSKPDDTKLSPDPVPLGIVQASLLRPSARNLVEMPRLASPLHASDVEQRSLCECLTLFPFGDGFFDLSTHSSSTGTDGSLIKRKY